MTQRPPLAEHGLSTGKRARLHRMLFRHGLGNGTALVLPYDQGLEHGPRDFLADPASTDPRSVLRLAVECRVNAIALQVGLAEKFYWDYAGEVPLLLMLNARSDTPPEDRPFSPLLASVEDAVRLGADAVGYTVHVGVPAQEDDVVQFRAVRADAERLGVPLVVWAYPRAGAVARGGRDSFYAVEHAARTASELGADVVQVGFPKPGRRSGAGTAQETEFDAAAAVEVVVGSAGRTLLLVTGGERASDGSVLGKARVSMDAGAAGVVLGRSFWQRDGAESLRLAEQLQAVLEKYPSPAR